MSQTLPDGPGEVPAHVLPDVLEPGLKIVFCGTAAGRGSAIRGAYYAGRGNKFWKTLHAVGLTPYPLEPREFRTLSRFGVGLSDLAKYASGADSSLLRTDYAVPMFEEKILRLAPKLVCFNGKRAAKQFFGARRVEFGEHGARIGDARLFVAPSTSGAANRYWDVAYWQELAESVEHP